MSKINISHLEKLYIENKDYIDSLNKEELEKYVSSSFLYKEILFNIFYDYIKNGVMSERDYYSVLSCKKVLDIIDIYLKQSNIKIKEETMPVITGGSSLHQYISNIPKEILSPEEEKRLFYELKNKKIVFNESKEKIFELKKKKIYDQILRYRGNVSIKALLEAYKEGLFIVLNSFNPNIHLDIDKFIDKELSKYVENNVNTSNFFKVNKRTEDETEFAKELIKERESLAYSNVDEKTYKEFIDSKIDYDHIINRIITHNLQLVIWKLKEMKLLYGCDELEDRIQDGNLGLLKALEKYDPSMNTSFSTYAYWWIRQSVIYSYFNNYQQIATPQYISVALSKMKKIKRDFYADNGRVPTEEELAELLKVPTPTVKRLVELDTGITSLDTEIGEPGDERTIGEMTEDPKQNVEEQVMVEDLKNNVIKALGSLKDSERFVIMLLSGITYEEPQVFNINKEESVIVSFDAEDKELMSNLIIEGFDYNDGQMHKINEKTSYLYYDGHNMTLEEVGKLLNKTHQRISNIKKDCYKKLKIKLDY